MDVPDSRTPQDARPANRTFGSWCVAGAALATFVVAAAGDLPSPAVMAVCSASLADCWVTTILWGGSRSATWQQVLLGTAGIGAFVFVVLLCFDLPWWAFAAVMLAPILARLLWGVRDRRVRRSDPAAPE